MVYPPREIAGAPLWVTDDAAARATRERALHEAFEVADEIGGGHIVVFTGAFLDVPMPLQRAAFAEHLERGAALAARRNKVLLLENMSRSSRPGALLAHVADAYAVVKAVDSPHVRLVFDTAHVQAMDGDLDWSQADRAVEERGLAYRRTIDPASVA